MAEFRGLFKTPCFYYSLISIILLLVVYFSISRFPKNIIWPDQSRSNVSASTEGVLSFNQSQVLGLEPPDLKIIQDDSLAAFTPPRVLSPKVLGAYFGQGQQPRTEITDYSVQPGDTLKSIAQKFDISLATLLLANDLNSSSKIKNGQSLVILPVDGLIYVAQNGDTLSAIAKIYKANVEDIISSNNLSDESDVYVGDILVIPNGVMPKQSPTYGQTYLADSYFIFPTEGEITQTLHWYNGVDIGNQCGTPIYAAVAGTVLRARLDTVTGGGNVITIKDEKGVVAWYGHLMAMLVAPGQTVDVGQKIGLMGGKPGMEGAGNSTGCHLHFTVIGAKNPFGNWTYGQKMKYVSN